MYHLPQAMSSEWFGELGQIYFLLPKYSEAYPRLASLYLRLLDEATLNSEIHLAGCFSKTDYLLKKNSAQPALRRMVNDMRLRLTSDTQAQCPENFIYDFQALCLFVALLYGVPVPHTLRENFPKDRPSRSKHHLRGDYLRCVVVSWDEEYIYATSELTSETEVIRYAGTNQLYGNDHSYLSTLLHKGMMLNVVSPHSAPNGILLPEYIILEPDYLVDVSAVASCFQPYDASPLAVLQKRLEPSLSSEPILMGNMAGELLDTLLHGDNPPDASAQALSACYKTAANQLFLKAPVALVSHMPDRAFHEKAWSQMLNIHRAMSHTMPTLLEAYHRDKIIVEPTFFSEMLGLQGRMDMLQTDMRILVEQKAGSAAFVPNAREDDAPRHKEQHYIQMLLYMAIIRYNFRKVYQDNNQQLHAFLLYSKYSRPLVGLGFAPKLLFDAIRMRNMYVAQERDLCHGGISCLLSLTPDDFNPNGLSNTLWLKYHRPRIEAFLGNIQKASPLEQQYFQRFYTFLALEHRLSKIGNQTKEASGFASAWLSPFYEKQHVGNILSHLSLHRKEETDSEQVASVVLRYHGEAGNFRAGDIVVLYSYPTSGTPDIRQTIVHRGTITSITHQAIVVRLRTPQKNLHAFSAGHDMAWCLEHDFMESSYSGLYRGLYAFLCAPRYRRELILAQRPPRVDNSLSIRGDYGPFNDMQTRIKHARELFLIIGPPGTGKTSYGMLHTVREELLEEGSRVLIVSFTNRSVDEICSKLYPATDFVRLGGSASSSGLYADREFSAMTTRCSSAAELKDRFLRTRVVVGTTASVISHLPLLSMCRFTLCVVDEASQILEPHIMPLLSLADAEGHSCISRFVMIGDHKQLPAVVQQRTTDSRVDDPTLREIGLTDCRNSLFERLLARYRNNPEVCYMLTRQGRMHPDIARFPNLAFYGGKLTEVPLPHQMNSSSSPRVRFIHVPPAMDVATDRVNANEAEAIARELLSIWECTQGNFSPAETVGVIVPYRNQISAIREKLSALLQEPEHPLMQITIDTVERYQGSQRDYIIYGFTVQRPYQLRFLTETTFVEDNQIIDRKLNVAMTRAREYLLITGNAPLLRTVPLYARLLDYIGVGE